MAVILKQLSPARIDISRAFRLYTNRKTTFNLAGFLTGSMHTTSWRCLEVRTIAVRLLVILVACRLMSDGTVSAQLRVVSLRLFRLPPYHCFFRRVFGAMHRPDLPGPRNEEEIHRSLEGLHVRSLFCRRSDPWRADPTDADVVLTFGPIPQRLTDGHRGNRIGRAKSISFQ